MLELAKAKSAFNPSIVVLAEAKSTLLMIVNLWFDNNVSVSDNVDCVADKLICV